ncbi:neutral zinc metallopeptidase [uncultured Hyphomonas sp.]|uniref:KPN_02809 family neutral zinc metallopeptidase n=1 Tax=uncultured Hyphomonas sp. TaxID=225298 RepID=UPI002AABC9B1|nr:neutral zinc metallopeptidase [uncultured Hyphomonas sp.]
MRWQGGRKGGNIEDRRGMGPGKVAGGGIGVIIIALIGYFVLGMEPEEVAQIVGNQSAGNAASTQEGVRGTPEDEAGQFVDIISANINDVWSQGLNGYRAPTVVLYEQGTGTGCGYGQAAMGPFYCPADQTVYLDLGFWQDMQTQLGASGADFAKAYVIAHEFGHHVQKLTGATDKVRQAQQAARSQEEANAWSIALELQADCYAGVWAAHAADVSGGAVALEAGDVEEGLRTAQAIGDDMIQKRMTGKVTPEAFTHGTADQRVEWLRRGLSTGDPNACDTFSQ